MAKTGRPSSYSPEMAAAICEEIATTDHSLLSICSREEMASQSMVYRWLEAHEDFRENYARARERQADFMAAQTINIADDVSGDAGFTGNIAVSRSRLRIDGRKWLASKLAPKKYGDKLAAEVSGPDGGPVSTSLTVRLIDPDA